MKLPAALERAIPFVWGAVAVAGLAVAVVPQHAGSIVRLLAATLAGTAVLLVVVDAVGADLDPAADRRPPSPIDRPAPPPLRPMEPPALAAARRRLVHDITRRGGDPTNAADVAAATDRILDPGGTRT